MAFHFTFKDKEKREDAVRTLSRASAIILLIVYFVYLAFLLVPRRPTAILKDEEVSNRMFARHMTRGYRTIYQFRTKYSTDKRHATTRGAAVTTSFTQNEIRGRAVWSATFTVETSRKR